MLIKSGQEALYVAIEMERGAIQTYERALQMTDTGDPALRPLRQQLTIILGDEHQHLDQFQSLYQGLDAALEKQLMLSAVASSVLFEGGLMGAVRQGMLKDKESLLRFAVQAEKKAAETYRAFAETCGDPDTAAVLNGIADEEEKHLRTLRDYR
jgi:rubrerythrin